MAHTIILRRVGPTCWQTLGAAGPCRVGLAELVGIFPSAVNRVVFLPEERSR